MIGDWYITWLALCGIPVQAWLGWKIGRYGYKSFWSACSAASVCRWGFAVGKVHGFTVPAWKWVPGLFVREWWGFFKSPYYSTSMSHPHGKWNGIGDWSVFPKRDSMTK